MTDLTSRVIAILTTELGELHIARVQTPITADSDLKADIGMDSMDTLLVANALDEALGIELPDASVEGWTDVRSVVASVARLVREEKPPAKNPVIFYRESTRTLCDHEFGGWRAHDDGRGGEQFCQKCGLGAMAHSMVFLR